MKNLMIGFMLAASTMMVGCVSHAPVPPMDKRVTISPDICYEIYVTDVRCTKGNSDFTTLQANVVNNCQKPIAVDWKVIWLDADGMEIESLVSTWNAMMVQPMEIRGLKNTAPRADAADMRLYIRKSR